MVKHLKHCLFILTLASPAWASDGLVESNLEHAEEKVLCSVTAKNSSGAELSVSVSKTDEPNFILTRLHLDQGYTLQNREFVKISDGSVSFDLGGLRDQMTPVTIGEYEIEEAAVMPRLSLSKGVTTVVEFEHPHVLVESLKTMKSETSKITFGESVSFEGTAEAFGDLKECVWEALSMEGGQLPLATRIHSETAASFQKLMKKAVLMNSPSEKCEADLPNTEKVDERLWKAVRHAAQTFFPNNPNAQKSYIDRMDIQVFIAAREISERYDFCPSSGDVALRLTEDEANGIIQTYRIFSSNL